MLKLINFTKSYGNQTVINVKELIIPKGISWLLGKNVPRKTTLLRVLAGVESFKGTLLLDDLDIHSSPVDYRRKVNFGEADPLFPSFLTGLELIQLFCSAKQTDEKQADDLIKSFQAYSFIEQHIATYSAGMLKKLSLILAFLGNPSFILLDEPLTTLDQQAHKTLLDLIAMSYSQKNINFIISSHHILELQETLPIQRFQIQDTAIEWI